MPSATTSYPPQGSQPIDRAREEAQTATDKVKDAASHAGAAASNVAAAVGQKADEARSNLGSGIQSLGDSVREAGPRDGMLGKATAGVADALEQGGRYLEKHDLGDMSQDVTNLIRRNPVPALCIALGVGFLLARAIKS